MTEKYRVLGPGAHGPAVADVHAGLLAAGLDVPSDELVESTYAAGTRRAVLAFQHSNDLVPTGAVDDPTTAALGRHARQGPRRVVGWVHGPDGRPAEGLVVRAYDRDIRGEQPLGKATTDVDGFYALSYGEGEHGAGAQDTADVFVRVFAGRRQLTDPPVEQTVFNAPALVSISVVLAVRTPPAETEYEHGLRLVDPARADVGWTDLREDAEHRDATFLTGETGLPRHQVEHLVLAQRLAVEQDDGAPECWYAVLATDVLVSARRWATATPLFHLDLSTPSHDVVHAVALMPSEDLREAVAQAVERFVVPRSALDGFDRFAELVGRQADAARKRARTERQEVAFRHLQGFLSSDAHARVRSLLARDPLGDLGAVFTSLSEAGTITVEAADQATTALSLADLLGDDDALQERLRERHGVRGRAGLRRLAELDDDEWADVLAAGPARRRGRRRQGVDDRSDVVTERQARLLARRMEERFPTTAFAARLRRDPATVVPGAEAVGRLLQEHPDFDLVTGSARALSDDTTPEVLSDLRTVQRVFKVAPRYGQTTALLAQGVRSAADVQAVGRRRFLHSALESGEFSPQEAERTYAKATDQHTATVLLAGQIASAAEATTVAAIAEGPATGTAVTDAFPTMQSLFGGGDMCACEECRSVHGAPAYLVDVLQFLKNRLVVDTTAAPAVTLKQAKDVLFGRRPDLGDTDLSCANTNVPLPYLDLVCELLEEAVAPAPGVAYTGALAPGVAEDALVTALADAGWPFTARSVVSGPDASGAYVVRDGAAVARLTPSGGQWTARRLRQTIGTAAEVAAAPEHVNAAAYATLAATSSAFGLPFDLPHEEVAGWFSLLGVRRADLMRLLATGGASTAAQAAGDLLGLSEPERRLVVDADPGGQDTVWSTPNASTALADVDAFVTRSGIAYTALLELVDLPWVDGGQDLFVRHLDSTCDLSAKEIVHLDDAALDRIHRFSRLRTALGWSAPTLDRAISHDAVGAGALDDPCLERVVALEDLRGRLRLPVEDLLDLLGPLTPTGPTWTRVLLTASSVGGAVAPQFTPEAVAASEAAELAQPGDGERLADHAAYLALALGARDVDVTALLDEAGGDPPLTAATVSRVHGLWRLARALRLPPADVVQLASLTTTDPLASLEALDAFVTAAVTVRAAAAPVPALAHLLRHDAPDLAAVEPPAATVTAFVDDLEAALTAAAEQTASPFSAAAAVTENAAAVRAFAGMLPGLAPDDQGRLQTLLDDAWTDAAQTEAAFVTAVLGGYADVTAVQAALVTRAGAAPSALPGARNDVIAAVGAAVSDHLFSRAREAALTTSVATLLGVPEQRAGVLVGHVRRRQPGPATPLAREVLLDTAAPDADKEAVARLLHKVVVASAPYELDDDLLAWVLDHAADLGWLAWDALPAAAGETAADFDAWTRLHGFLGLCSAYPPVAAATPGAPPLRMPGLYDLVLAAAPVAEVLGVAASLAGLDPVVLGALDAHLGTSAADLTAYHDPAAFGRLFAAAGLLRRLALDVPAAVALAQAVVTAADATRMRTAVKARYSDAEWLGVLGQVQDGLREKKRDALVTYLLATSPGFRDANDLYDHFLIDVEMSSCMDTSRIVQAHATVQLFVQRCLMGVEPESVASVKHDDGWKQWQWMANFRVWEANRKIFLWPENWLQPELRDDKTELFTALDDTLQQNPLTEIAVEDATAAYLEQLDDLAHLDVVATYYEAPRRTMHVFARTKGGSPAVHYHRELQRERYWTPWATVPLDITGRHLLAFDRNDRLTLAWPVFTEEPDLSKAPPDTPDPAALGGGQANDKPEKRWKIQLAVSERAGGAWRPKRVSEGFLATDYAQELAHPDDINFFAWELAGSQAITCVGPSGTIGSFSLTGCKGHPEPTTASLSVGQAYPHFVDTQVRAGRFVEQGQDGDDSLTVVQLLDTLRQEILHATPGRFAVTYPLQMSLVDMLLYAVQAYFGSGQVTMSRYERRRGLPLGTFMPWFYGDFERTYVVVPGMYPRDDRQEPRDPDDPDDPDVLPTTRKTFSDLLIFVEDAVALAKKYLQLHQDKPDLTFQELVDLLLADPEFIRLREELRVYTQLRYGLDFRNFYHPLVCAFRSALHAHGVPGLLDRDLQLTDTGFDFAAHYAPTDQVVVPYPREDVDFTLAGAYSAYNWELFFHLPMDIASRLSADQQFELARTWMHYVFDPVGAPDAPAPQRYWNTKPFFRTTAQDYLDARIGQVLGDLAADPSGATVTELAFAVQQWREKPFRPHVVARSRPVAYQKAVVLAYVQNLVDWGDHLFRQFTRESVTQATQMYVLADQLLGAKPRVVPPAVEPPPMTYNQLEPDIDLFGNALLDLEALVPDLDLLPHGGAELPPPPATLTSTYFCIPPNSRMLEIWDLVADRLLKIRHCKDIEGVDAPLALFSPPIDPGALARAVAGGMSIASFVEGLGAPLPHHRFSVWARKASELTNQVGALGGELLTVLEKRDAESLSRLRANHEVSLLAAMREVKEATRREAEGGLVALRRQREVVAERQSFYESQEFMNAWEVAAVALNGVSLLGEAAVALGYLLSGGLKLIPDFMAGAAGFGGSPTVTATMGGQSIGNGAEMAAQVISSLTRVADKGAGMASTEAGEQRRQEEWTFQAQQAARELAHVDQQIANAQLHLDTLARDLAVHDRQTAHAATERDAMLRKYTNQELYEWMAGRITSVYFRAYQLAHDAARTAQRCYDYELATSSSFIGYAYWDSARKGLMAHHALELDLARMEAAYLKGDEREYELTKQVSLARLDPGALIRLQATGKTVITVPETAFDMDHPSHYMRRLKSAAVTIVCSAGPYTTVAATLSLVSNKYRKLTTERAGAANDKDKYAEVLGSDDRFAYNVAPIGSIATSTAASDSGLFELSFSDERYLPFEGAGAVSTWQLELPMVLEQIDRNTISDVVLHLRYTAREGGSGFRSLVEGALVEVSNEMLLSGQRQGWYAGLRLREQFPDAWWQLTSTGATSITVGPEHLPHPVRKHAPAITAVTWVATVQGSPASYPIEVGGAALTLDRDTTMPSLCSKSGGALTLGAPVTLEADGTKLLDLTMLVQYALTP